MTYTSVLNKGIILLLLLGATMTLHADSKMKWLIVYSDQLTANQLQDVGMAVVEPDVVKPSRYPGIHTKFYGYVSLGAVDIHRPYWPQIRDTSAVVENDPEWPDSYRMDIRAKTWQNLLLKQIIPQLAKEKFSGVFLDTIDTPVYLEERDPKRFAKSKKTLVEFITEIKKKFPHMGILPNNGFSILDDIGNVVDGVVAEDVYTRYNFKTKTYEATPTEDTDIKQTALDTFMAKFKKPVFVVLYGKPTSQLIQDSIAKCKNKGYHWYVTTVDLMKVGEVEK